MSDNASIPPGWYYASGDPEGTQRYWDGELWQGTPVPVNPVAAPPPQPRYAAPHPGQPRRGSYAEWGTRVGATLIDALIMAVVFVAVLVLATVLGNTSETLGLIVGFGLGIPLLLALLYLNLWLPGITGQSPGRRVMGYMIVSERDGSFIGPGAFIGRWFIGNIINNFCYIDYLWPLWDDKNQRLADKVVSSVAVRTDAGKLFPMFPNGKPF